MVDFECWVMYARLFRKVCVSHNLTATCTISIDATDSRTLYSAGVGTKYQDVFLDFKGIIPVSQMKQLVQLRIEILIDQSTVRIENRFKVFFFMTAPGVPRSIFYFFCYSRTIWPSCVQKVRQKNQEMKVLMDQMRNLLWDVNAMLTLRKWWRASPSQCWGNFLFAFSNVGPRPLGVPAVRRQKSLLPFYSLPCRQWGEPVTE